MSKRTTRAPREDWQVKVYQTSVTEGPWTLTPGVPDGPDIRIQAGESLLLDFGRSIDVAFSLDGDGVAPLPSGSFLDPLAGCFGWQPARPADTPVVLHFVSGARRLTTSIAVGRKSTI